MHSSRVSSKGIGRGVGNKGSSTGSKSVQTCNSQTCCVGCRILGHLMRANNMQACTEAWYFVVLLVQACAG
jgi:hypothetical protein